jgi:hypothetical protein
MLSNDRVGYVSIVLFSGGRDANVVVVVDPWRRERRRTESREELLTSTCRVMWFDLLGSL